MPQSLSKITRRRRFSSALQLGFGLLALIGAAMLSDLAQHEAHVKPAIAVTLMLTGLLSIAWAAWHHPFRMGAGTHRLRFTDVAGAEEAKKNLMEVAAYLKAPRKYEAIGAVFPRGVILHGAPGTGKTLLAKALAGEAGAHFMAVNGADFGSMLIGVAAAKVRRQFARARALAPCVLFIDEIDAVGGKRLEEGSAAAREMGATLNALLVEMDGFGDNSGVIVVAATNRLAALDPALLRSGRFDRRIQLNLPSLKERADILQIHGRKITLAKGIDYLELARQTIGFSGADLANLMNQAALLAVHQNAEVVDMTMLLRARNVMLMGEESRSTLAMLDGQTRHRLAIHECGHAIVAMAGNLDPVTAVSIVPRGLSLGQTFIAPLKDMLLHSQHALLNQINILVAGRVAEEIFSKSISTGADDDIARATELALAIVGRHGMTDFGMMHVGEQASPQLRYAAECRAIELIDQARSRAGQILNANFSVVERMALRLVDVEEMDQFELRQFKALLAPQSDMLARAA